MELSGALVSILRVPSQLVLRICHHYFDEFVFFETACDIESGRDHSGLPTSYADVCDRVLPLISQVKDPKQYKQKW